MNITRHKAGKGFSYKDQFDQRLCPQSSEGKKIRTWINSLGIPPAWKRVRINANPKAKIFATGRDANGKKQYIYNPDWRALRNQEKFERVLRFANKLDDLRTRTHSDLSVFFDRESSQNNSTPPRLLTRYVVLACMVRLIDSAYFRPGNLQYSTENQSYGITTLRSKHLDIKGDELIFEYQGKSGVEQSKKVVSDRLANIVAALDDQPGYRIFKYYEDGRKVFVNSENLNAYIKSIMGEEFSAKDFRTWAATVITARELVKLGSSRDQKESRANVVSALKITASRLGNTPTICGQNYVDPRIIEAYMNGISLKNFKSKGSADQQSYLSADEQACIDLLESID